MQKVFAHPQVSPDLSPCDYFPFPEYERHTPNGYFDPDYQPNGNPSMHRILIDVLDNTGGNIPVHYGKQIIIQYYFKKFRDISY